MASICLFRRNNFIPTIIVYDRMFNMDFVEFSNGYTAQEHWVKDLSCGTSGYPSAEVQLERAKSVILELINMIDSVEFGLQEVSTDISTLRDHYCNRTGPFAGLEDDPTMCNSSFYDACLANNVRYELSDEEQAKQNEELLNKARENIKKLHYSLTSEIENFGEIGFCFHEPRPSERLFEAIRNKLVEPEK